MGSDPLFLAETESQVEDILSRGENRAGTWIALAPSAAWVLSKKEISHLLLHQFCDRSELERECWEGFSMLSEAVSKLDSELLTQNAFLKEWGIAPFFLHLWQLAQCLDGLIFRQHVLRRVRQRFPQEKLVAHLAPGKEWGCFGIGFSSKETLWGRVLELWGDERVELLPWADVSEKESLNASQRVKRGLARSLFFQSLLQSLRWKLWKNMEYLLMRGALRGKVFVLLGSPFEWKAFLSDLTSQGNQLFFLSHLPYSNDLDSLKKGSWTRDFLPLPLPKGIAELFFERVSFIASSAPRLAFGWIKWLERAFPKNVHALLSGPCPEYWKGVAAAFCRQRKIPVYTFQHGSEWVAKGRISQKQDLMVLPYSRVHFVFGEGVRRGYEKSLYLQNETRVVSVGMPSLQKLHGLEPKRKKEIHLLWPFGGYNGNGWYCSFSPPTVDTLAYAEQLIIVNGLIQLLQEHPDFHLTVKLYSSTYCACCPPWIEKFQGIERAKAVENPPFRDLLSQQSAVLLDSPTTTLLEAAATKLPLFVCTSVVSWGEEAHELLRRRACVASSAKEVIASLRRFVLFQEYPADVEEGSFLREYGLAHENPKQKVMDLLLDEEALCAL